MRNTHTKDGTMTDTGDTDYTPEPPRDPAAQVIESIQFGEVGEAADKLKTFIEGSFSEAERRRALAAEGRRSFEQLAEFKSRNPDLVEDERAQAAIERDLYTLQLRDLRAAGVNLDKWREDLGGRDFKPAEIAEAHKVFRAMGARGVRPVSELLGHAEQRFNEWHGRRRSGGSVEADRTRAVRERMTADRRRRGLPEVAVEPDANVPADRYADHHSPAEETSRMFSGDADAPNQDESRSRAVEQVRLERRRLRGPGAALLVDGRLGGERVGSRSGLVE
jgi:hypothetical protein